MIIFCKKYKGGPYAFSQKITKIVRGDHMIFFKKHKNHKGGPYDFCQKITKIVRGDHMIFLKNYKKYKGGPYDFLQEVINTVREGPMIFLHLVTCCFIIFLKSVIDTPLKNRDFRIQGGYL